MKFVPDDQHLHIGGIIFPNLDQFDFNGPFEVLARIPNSTFHVLGKDKSPVRDVRGLVLLPGETLAESPQLDVLLVPGGAGQVEMMEDEEVLAFIRRQAAGAKIVFSVCTGMLILAAAGLLRGVKSTTHWSAFHFLEQLGIVPVDQRVVVDGKFVSAAGVSSGIDGALRVAAMLRGDAVAQQIQLYMQYAPEPPFDSGVPATAPAAVLAAAHAAADPLTAKRQEAVNRLLGKK
jgi:cyclohexyl-isocyanide hydratase